MTPEESNVYSIADSTRKYDSGGVECLSGNQKPDAMGAETIVTCLLNQVFKHATPLELLDPETICAFYRHTTPPESVDELLIHDFYKHSTPTESADKM